MAGIGPTLFGVLLWGGLIGVFLVFCYELYVVAREYGLVATDGR